MILPSLSITDYIIGGLLVTLAGTGIYAFSEHTALTLKTAEFEKFKSDTKAAGAEQLAKNANTEKQLAMSAINIQEDLNGALTSYNKLFTEYNRLRHSSTSGSKASNLSEAASKLSCPSGEAKFAGALEYLEEGVLESFVKPLDSALIRLDYCVKYVNEVHAITQQ